MSGADAEESAGVGDAAGVDAGADAGSFPPFVPYVGVYAMAVVSMVLGVLVAPDLAGAGVQAYENPSSGTNLLRFAFWVAVGTVSILLVQRFGYGRLLLRGLFVGFFGYATALLVAVYAGGLAVPVAAGLAVFAALWFHPEWYVVDVAGVAFAAFAVAVFGISLVPGLVLLLLAVGAAYDAYSVYVSEHMQSLVDGGLDMKIPMAFVVPVDRSFSLRDVDDMAGLGDGEGPSAALLGYGDALFPGLLAVSAGHFLGPGTDPVAAPTLVEAVPYANAPAVGALVGGVVGTVGLHVLLTKVERTHPALVVLNPCVIAGYLVGALAAGVPLTTALGL